MAYKLVAQSDLPQLEFALTPGVFRIGSGRQCNIVIPHPEVLSHAVTLEYRGDTMTVKNHSPYPLYVGGDLVEPQGNSVWRADVPLLLTRNVSLILSDTARSPTSAPAVAHPTSANVEIG